MNERRSLIDGLKQSPEVDQKVEQDYVFGTQRHTPPSATPSATPSPPSPNRLPLSTRIREDFAKALKRASLERQLAGVEPSTLQDILEEALEPWLKQHGFLP